MPGKLQEDIAVTAYVVPLVFQATNIPDAAGTANGVEPTTPDYIMPWAGSVIGVSISLNANPTTGVITARPVVNGTGSTAVTAVVQNNTQRNTGQKPAGTLNFAAGSRIGADWTKSGTVAPTTMDATIIIWVLLNPVAV